MKSERNRNAEKALINNGPKLSKDDKAAQTAAMKLRQTAASVAKSGRDTRGKGHATVQTARQQGKRDSRQS